MNSAGPSSSEPYGARLAGLHALRERLSLDLLVLSRPTILRHALGYASVESPAVLTLDRGANRLLAPDSASLPPRLDALAESHIYIAYAAGQLIDPVVSLGAALERVLAGQRLGAVGIEAGHLPAALADRLVLAQRVDVGPELGALRVTKDAAEIAAIRRSVTVVEAAFEQARSAIRPGAREVDVLDAVRASLWSSVGDDVDLGYTLGSGPRSAEFEPHATNRRLVPGDLLLLDLYPSVSGYVADLARTFVVGTPNHDQRIHHQALEVALDAGAAALRPGASGRDIAETVRASLAVAAGELASSMNHHAGHGIGISAWEPPWLGANSDDVIGDASVIAIEVGLYVPDHWGMRIEGNFVVNADGLERLDRFPSGLILCP